MAIGKSACTATWLLKQTGDGVPVEVWAPVLRDVVDSAMFHLADIMEWWEPSQVSIQPGGVSLVYRRGDAVAALICEETKSRLHVTWRRDDNPKLPSEAWLQKMVTILLHPI